MGAILFSVSWLQSRDEFHFNFASKEAVITLILLQKEATIASISLHKEATIASISLQNEAMIRDETKLYGR